MKHTFGALPPKHFEWQIGKTAASITFVKDAEAMLARGELSQEEAQRLTEWIAKVKSGEDVLDRRLSDRDILARVI